MAEVRAKFAPAREMAFGSITASYTKIGTTFDDSYRLVFLQNFCNTIMDFSISYDGGDTSFSLAPGGTMAGDITANGGGGTFQIAKGESVFVKYRTVPTSGFVQFSSVIGV